MSCTAGQHVRTLLVVVEDPYCDDGVAVVDEILHHPLERAFTARRRVYRTHERPRILIQRVALRLDLLCEAKVAAPRKVRVRHGVKPGNPHVARPAAAFRAVEERLARSHARMERRLVRARGVSPAAAHCHGPCVMTNLQKSHRAQLVNRGAIVCAKHAAARLLVRRTEAHGGDIRNRRLRGTRDG